MTMTERSKSHTYERGCPEVSLIEWLRRTS